MSGMRAPLTCAFSACMGESAHYVVRRLAMTRRLAVALRWDHIRLTKPVRFYTGVT
jgi:hypothetical protein